MNNRQNGDHTWPLIIHYHRCPRCGYIIESREDYEYRLGQYQKDLCCERCDYIFTVNKLSQPKPAPFFGKESPVEMEWPD